MPVMQSDRRTSLNIYGALYERLARLARWRSYREGRLISVTQVATAILEEGLPEAERIAGLDPPK